MNRRLLPYSLYCSQVTKGSNEAHTELTAMLQEASNADEIAAIQAELEQVPAAICTLFPSVYLACRFIACMELVYFKAPHARKGSTKGVPGMTLPDLRPHFRPAACADDQETWTVQLKQGAEQRRKRLLKKVCVLGLTCCSAMMPVMDSLSFDVVILDECSQITEPLCLVPLIHASHCRSDPAIDPARLNRGSVNHLLHVQDVVYVVQPSLVRSTQRSRARQPGGSAHEQLISDVQAPGAGRGSMPAAAHNLPACRCHSCAQAIFQPCPAAAASDHPWAGKTYVCSPAGHGPSEHFA